MNPVSILFLLFLAIPMVEIYFLIKVGNIIGAFPTIFLVVFTAMLGAMLLRYQGWVTWQKTQKSMAQGQIPALEMMEGVLLLFSGALLLTPGFVTDTIGFIFLIPAARRALIRWFLKKSTIHQQGFQQADKTPSAEHPKPQRTIEGEYHRED